MAGFEPQEHAVDLGDMLAMDRWIMHRAAELQDEIVAAYEAYQFHLIYQKLHNFCVLELGGFYLDIIKDRQYTTKPNSLPRRSAQTAMYHIAEALTRWIAPILSFTADELWEHLPGEHNGTVFAAEWYQGLSRMEADAEMDSDFWETVQSVKSAVNKVLEGAKKEGLVGGSLATEVTLFCDESLMNSLVKLGDELRFVLISSAARLAPLSTANEAVATDVDGLQVRVAASDGEKCSRCWHHREEVGQSLEHPELCFRCIDNVDGNGEVRFYA
jgi:isoleucyl-tRNA synthetase